MESMRRNANPRVYIRGEMNANARLSPTYESRSIYKFRAHERQILDAINVLMHHCGADPSTSLLRFVSGATLRRDAERVLFEGRTAGGWREEFVAGLHVAMQLAPTYAAHGTDGFTAHGPKWGEL